MTTPTGVFIDLSGGKLTAEQEAKAREAVINAPAGLGNYLSAVFLAIGTPVTGGDLNPVAFMSPRDCASPSISFRPFHDYIPLVRQSDHLAALASLQAEVGRLQAKQPHYDRVIQENGELKLAVARLQKPEFYGTEGQDIGSDDVSSLFDFCENNEVIEVNGYRCVSTQFGFFDGIDVHLYNSEAEAVSEAKALKGPEA